MIELVLQRLEEVGDSTFGELRHNGSSIGILTLEELWVDKNGDGVGDRNVSRIPAGRYDVFRRMSPARGYEVFELENVPGRGNIQIHKGNTTADTLGCILIGLERGTLDGKPAVLRSGAAFGKLMKAYPDFVLTVRDIGA